MSVTAELEKLVALRKAGTITEEEFVKGKRQVLDGGGHAQGRSTRSVFDWRFATVAVIAIGALGIIGWSQVGIEPEPDPMLVLVSIGVVFLAVLFARPFAWFGWGLGFGAEDEPVIPLVAVIAFGAAALAGGAVLIGLPLIAIGLVVVAVLGAAAWCWEQLFGD
ncbi:MAG: SHOCT domain-containing protein [Pseudomonadota bacterium]